MLKLNRIFIINLKHRTDRREHILSEMKRQNITNFEFFDAIRPTLEEVNDWNPTYCHHVIKHVSSNKFDNYRMGCLGCLKSHLGVMKLALARGYKRILVLEDDTVFIRPWADFKKLIEPLKKYDILYLCGSHIKKCQPIKISGKAKDTNIITGTHALALSNIKKVVKALTTGSYCIGERAMRFFVSNIIEYSSGFP